MIRCRRHGQASLAWRRRTSTTCTGLRRWTGPGSRTGWRRETGDRTRKARNLARDPRCTLTVAAREFDLSVEGEAHKVTDPDTVAAMAARWAAAGWPARPDDTGHALTAAYSAPSAGPPPWYVYRITARAATAVGTVEPYGATRWRF